MKRIQLAHKNKISKAIEPITCTEDEDKSSLWYLLVLTLAPIYLLVIIGAIVFALIMLDRHFIDLSNFMLQQYIFVGIMIIGMTIAIVVYSFAVKRALRQIGVWRQNGHSTQANVGLLLLTLVASLMVLPVILALFFH